MLVKTIEELSQLKLIANYISALPPEELRSQLPSEMLPLIVHDWYWIGRSFNSFFSGEPDPIDNAGLSSESSKRLKACVSKYIALSELLFKTERLLHKEAQAQGNPYFTGLTRFDILKIWFKEECFFQISLLEQSHWESHSKRQNNERSREILKYFEGEVSDEKWEILKSRWSKEDRKLNQPIDAEDLMPFTNFCLQVFKNYRSDLPEAHKFLKSWYEGMNTKKFTVVNGIPQLNPVRGKDKNKRRAKTS